MVRPMSSLASLAQILPPRVRYVIYVVFSFAALVASIVISALNDGFQWNDVPIIISGVLTAGGFGMAAANTPGGTNVPA